MSGHPHPGRRSEWFSVIDMQPEIYGQYETKCEFGGSTINIWIAHKRLEKSEICPQCQWRGLAEKPE